MSDTDELQAIAGRLTSALVSLYGGPTAGTLAYLPGGVPVPDTLVQDGTVNPAQVGQWLQTSFDASLLVSPADATIVQQADSSVSGLYGEAVSFAVPAAPPGSADFERLTAEIAQAQQAYGPGGGIRPVSCEPGDWPVATNDDYWTVFDSDTTTSTATTSGGTEQPAAVNPVLWRVRVLRTEGPPDKFPQSVEPRPPEQVVQDVPPPLVQAAPIADPTTGPTVSVSPVVMSAVTGSATTALLTRPGTDVEPILPHPVELDPVVVEPLVPVVTTVPVASAPVSSGFSGPVPVRGPWGLGTGAGLSRAFDTAALFANAPVVDQVTTSASSSISLQLEHMCVALSRDQSGQPWWDGTFLADPGWYVPGMPRGLLVPDVGATPPEVTVWAVPRALVVVRNLQVTGQWSAAASSTLSDPAGTFGPLGLFGAQASSSSGSTTYSHAGMQVVAVLCTALPVVPPLDSPPAP